MKLLLPASVFVLMVSVGMSLRWRELVANWRRLTWSAWLRLLLATFIVPPAVALLLARILPLNLSETAGLFMVAAAPGAPLLTRNLARRGFDMHLAASYQVWGAVMTPIMIPLLVAGAAKLYGRDIWIPPMAVVIQILEKEFVPLLVGMALAHFTPVFSKKAQAVLNILANCTLTLVFVVLLWKMGPELRRVTPWVVLAAVLLLASSIAAMRLLMSADPIGVRTLAVSNANRHVGLALLLSGQYIHNRDALPTVASYAIVVALLMLLAPKLFRQKDPAARGAAA
ncbi:MAG: bile acid:sodium symporter [Candidatus Korobacteraceae bacterium]|jgi:BASS family bile acid:Na+ symporter